jgi:hypothetical protein
MDDALNALFHQTAAKRNGAQIRALQKRDQDWPGAAELVWNRTKHKGFTSIPRTMPYVMLAMDSLCKNAPPSAAYFVLWCRAFDEHMLIIENPAILAAESGYGGQRAVTTWNARMKSLVELGFIEAKRGPASEYQKVLLKNPNTAMQALENAGRFKNSAQRFLYEQFINRAIDIGAKDVILGTVEDPEKGEGPSVVAPGPSSATSPAGQATLAPPISEKGSA